MAVLKKEEILGADDRKTETISVPEWGGHVSVATMSGTERDDFEQSVVETRGSDTITNLANIRAKLCAKCMVDDDRKRIFADSDVKALGEKSAAALDRVFAVAQRLNGLSGDDVEGLVKNSEGGPSAASTSD